MLSGFARANAISEAEYIRRYYPRLEQVISYVSTEINSYCKDCMYGVAKKPEGYFLTLEALDNNPNHDVTFIKVWDRLEADFVAFDISEYESDQPLYNAPEEFRVLHEREQYYDFFLYYGYSNWTEDTRILLDKQNYKSSADLEILARASATEAMAYIRPGLTGDFFGFALGLEDQGYGKTTDIQRYGFEKKTEESLGYWKELKNKFPDHKPIIIDDLGLKIGHEYMHFYQMALSIDEKIMADDFFKNAYYTEAWIQYAKNMLEPCEENGILFTSGDSDTFPLLYIQEKLGFRTDVTVVNTSLLNTSWYWEMICDKNKIKTNISADDHQKLQEKTVYIDYSEPSTPYKQWLDNLLKSEDTLTYHLAPSQLIISYRESNLALDIKSMNLTVSNMIVLDILESTKRPVYTSDPYSMVNIGMYYYLATTGRSFSVVPDMDEALESIATVENVEYLASYTTKSYLEAIGSTAGTELSILSYLVLNIPDAFQDRKDAIVEKIYTNLAPDKILSVDDFGLMDALNSFYEVMKPDAGEELRDALKPLALNLIENTSALNYELGQNIEDLTHIFSIYAHFRPHENPMYDIEITETDRAVLAALKEKVVHLSESPVLLDQAWKRRLVFEMRKALEMIATE